MSNTTTGLLLREWRTRRRYSQLDLAHVADVSSRHLSFIETGRSKPSPEMIVHLCECLDVPLRSRNQILLAAGFAPRYGHSPLGGPSDELRANVERLIASHRDPTLVVDRDWTLVTANAAAMMFLDGVAGELLVPPINVVRLSLHPDGLASRIANFDEYASHVLTRVGRAVAALPSPALESILDDYRHLIRPSSPKHSGLFLTLDLNTPAGLIRFFSTITVFGSPRDVAVDELALETFHPADEVSQQRYAELTSP